MVRCGERIDLAHVIRMPEGRPEVCLLDSFRMEGSEAQALERLKVAKNLGAFRCVTVLGENDYRLVQLEAPSVPPEERLQALRWRLKDMVDFPVETAAVQVLDIPLKDAGGRTPSVFVATAAASVVGERMGVFASAKLSLEAIDLPETAQRNVAALFEEPNRGLAFIALGEGDALLTITYAGELYFSRHIEISAKAMAEADVDRRQSLIERLVLELQRTLDNFDRQYSFISVASLMVASEIEVDGLLQALAENLYVPVKAADLSLVADFPAVPELKNPARQAQCLLAIGAALREDAP